MATAAVRGTLRPSVSANKKESDRLAKIMRRQYYRVKRPVEQDGHAVKL